MWLGCWPASCRIHSPRSVSTTRRPASSSASLSLISSVAIDFDLATSVAPARRGEVGDVAAGGVGVGRTRHDAAAGRGTRSSSRVEQLGQVADVAAADLARPVAHLRERVLAPDARPPRRPARRRRAQVRRRARRRRAPRGSARAAAPRRRGRRPGARPLIRRAPRRCAARAAGRPCAAPARRCAAGSERSQATSSSAPVAAAARAFSSPSRPETSGKLTLKVPPKPQHTSVCSISRSSSPATARERGPRALALAQDRAACGTSRGRSPTPDPRAPASQALRGEELASARRCARPSRAPPSSSGVRRTARGSRGAPSPRTSRGHHHRVVAARTPAARAAPPAAPARDGPTTSPAGRSRSARAGPTTSTPAPLEHRARRPPHRRRHDVGQARPHEHGPHRRIVSLRRCYPRLGRRTRARSSFDGAVPHR